MMIDGTIIIVIILVFIFVINDVSASAGDRSQLFINCLRGCRHNNCTEDGLQFKNGIEQEWINSILMWSCHDECAYRCMWRTTNAFIARQWDVPQFYGKWPFKRFFGIQEPASVLFSLLNLIVHWKMLRKFRKVVRSDSPMYYVWHVFCAISMNGWMCSIIFHSRDFPLTELLDYGFAYSMVLANFCCMLLRMLHWTSKKVKTFVSLILFIFFVNHFAYLSIGQFDYAYNMKANILTGIASGCGWIGWYVSQRKRKPYAWKILLVEVLVGISLLLELNDFPPLFWVFDAHSLWHLSTVLPTVLLYSFLIDDTINLRRIKYEQIDFDEEKEKLI